jgi:hypothetical protein
MELCPRPILPGTGAPRPGNGKTVSRAVPAALAVAAQREGQRGAGNLKAIVWTMILVAFIYVAAMAIPVLINEYQFQDSLDEIARYASVNHKTTEQIKKAVLDEAQKEDLPIQAEDIKVVGNAGNVHINVDYSVIIDLKVYQWTLNFHPAASNAALF